jgi:hypothetical protein
METMIIHPNVGIGEVKFGMSPFQVRSIMGNNLFTEEWMADTFMYGALFYSDILIDFDTSVSDDLPSNSKVIELRTNNSQRVEFNGINLFDLTRENLTAMSYQGIKAEAYDGGDVAFPSLGLNFNFNTSGYLESFEMVRK